MVTSAPFLAGQLHCPVPRSMTPSFSRSVKNSGKIVPSDWWRSTGFCALLQTDETQPGIWAEKRKTWMQYTLHPCQTVEKAHVNARRADDLASSKSPRQSFSIRGWKNKLKSVFFGDMSIEKNTSGARQCGIGSSFDPIMRAAGCIPSQKCLHF